MPSCNITPYQWCVYWLLGLSEDLRKGLKINKGPLSGYIDCLHLWLPVGLQSIQFRPPYKVRIVRRFLTLWFDGWHITCAQLWWQFHATLNWNLMTFCPTCWSIWRGTLESADWNGSSLCLSICACVLVLKVFPIDFRSIATSSLQHPVWLSTWKLHLYYIIGMWFPRSPCGHISCLCPQCTWKTFMIHETFVWWALYILFKFVKSLIKHLGLAIGNVRCVRWFSWILCPSVYPSLSKCSTWPLVPLSQVGKIMLWIGKKFCYHIGIGHVTCSNRLEMGIRMGAMKF